MPPIAPASTSPDSSATPCCPDARLIAAENLLRYNASLISVFDLLADARAQITGVDDYIRSVRDFWIAKSRTRHRPARQLHTVRTKPIMFTRRSFFSGAGLAVAAAAVGKSALAALPEISIHRLRFHAAAAAAAQRAALPSGCDLEWLDACPGACVRESRNFTWWRSP